MKIIYLVLLALFLFSCSSSKKESAIVPQNLGGHYEIIQVNSNTNLPAQVTINFDSIQQKISGNAGCNQFFGSYSLKDQNLNFSQLGTTKKLCFDDAVNKVETEALQSLEQIATYEFKEEQLYLKNENGTTIFVAVPFTALKKKEIAQTDFKITYDVGAMNGQEQIIMTPEKMTCNKLLPEATEMSYGVLPMAAKKAEAELSKLPLDKIESLESPTNDRHLDGAAYAKLIIEYQGKTYKTQDFDHGNPPADLKSIVQFLLDNTPCP